MIPEVSLGGGAVVSGKRIPHNSIWAGNPVRMIKNDIFWDAACVHQWTEDTSDASRYYDDYLNQYNKRDNSDGWIYEYSQPDSMDFNTIDAKLNSLGSSEEKCDYLKQLDENKKKNRFVHGAKF